MYMYSVELDVAYYTYLFLKYDTVVTEHHSNHGGEKNILLNIYIICVDTL